MGLVRAIDQGLDMLLIALIVLLLRSGGGRPGRRV